VVILEIGNKFVENNLTNDMLCRVKVRFI